MSYCLKSLDDWPNNIILDEVAAYIARVKHASEEAGKPFPLHKYVHHGLSSQAMVFNLVGPLITRDDYEPFVRLLAANGVEAEPPIASAVFEYEDRDVFNEDTGQPTSIDIVLQDEAQTPVIFIESKLVERGFGGCSVFAAGDCDGANPVDDKNRCYLHFIGRRYWTLMEKHGFTACLQQERQCVFTAYYQFFRELLFALEKGCVFVLLSDDRSPVFHCAVDGDHRGLMTFLRSFVPPELQPRIVSVSVQALVDAIRASGNHGDWIGAFERKYGLAQG
jgi:hypothetical protein